ncbi:hypothetical protein BT96DRAFT_825985, partial [Gymnopus androsaceus JB14]
PGLYANTPRNAAAITQVLANPAFQAVATFVDRGLRSFFPKLHSLAVNLDKNIVDADNPQIERAFKDCCYPACHFNLNNACTLVHNNYWNLFCFMCAIACIGPFDHTWGGHVIAWSLGLVFEFPSGSTMYLPSACVPHSNTPIAPNERRSSLAFFLPAGLARWYHNGFRSDKDFWAQPTPQQLKQWLDYRGKLWELGVELLKYDLN